MWRGRCGGSRRGSPCPGCLAALLGAERGSGLACITARARALQEVDSRRPPGAGATPGQLTVA
eukprot:6030964-Pyramimonas_sp.AAC.1